jgi:hypothetical protein
MQSLKEYLNEMKVEIPSTKGKEHAKALNNIGIKAKGDIEGIIVDIKSPEDKKKLMRWMLKNGWDKTDIRDGFPELLK